MENQNFYRDLSRSEVIDPKYLLNMSNQEEPNYIDDFLQLSPRAVLIDGNKTIPQKKKKIKIIKKKVKKNNSSNKELKKEIKLKNNQEKIQVNKSNEENNKTKLSKPEKEIKENKSKNTSEEKEKILKAREKMREKFIELAKFKILLDLKDALKVIYFFLQLKKYFINSSNKICASFRGYFVRENLRLNYLTKRIINYRDSLASKIIAYYKGYNIRKLSKKIIQKKEDFYILYSSLPNNKMLYFKIRYMSGLEDNMYFEYCKLLKCFVYYIGRKETTLSKKILEGFFYNEKYKKLVDDMYEKNSKGENIINIPQILKKNDINSEKYDKIINEYIKAHRPVKLKRENIIEYEEKKKKALDDDILMSNKRLIKLNKMNRSKSFIRLKGVKNKGILKPSKSYINLRTDDRKIQFGKAKIKGYHNQKK